MAGYAVGGTRQVSAARQRLRDAGAVDLISNRRVDMRPLLTATYPLERAVEAFELAGDKARAMKVQLSFAGA